MKTRQLTPGHDSRKSFYNKAKVILTEEKYTLISYETEVAYYFPNEKKLQINGWYSQTTARHINEFILQYAPWFSTMSKKEMELKPVKTI